jgi:hypothetical protein
MPVKPIALFALISILGFIPPAYARAERVPKLNVESSCRDAKTYGMADPKQTYKNCMADENQAKKQLEAKWPHYKAKTRHACVAAGANPSPSYVELLTCIEMTEEVLHPQSGMGGGGGGTGGESGAGGGGTGAGGNSGGAGGGGSVGGSPPPRPALAPEPRAMPH